MMFTITNVFSFGKKLNKYSEIGIVFNFVMCFQDAEGYTFRGNIFFSYHNIICITSKLIYFY